MDLFETIRGRRSIRRYTEQPVEDEKLFQVLDAARLAPSWKNLQCWRFLVVRDAVKKDAILTCLHETNPGKKALFQAPVNIVVCADPSESGVKEGKDFYLADAAIAFEHLCLAAHALGLGTCWIGWLEEEVLKQALSIPNELRVLGITPLGYPAQEPNPRPRKSLNEIVYLNEWGVNPWE